MYRDLHQAVLGGDEDTAIAICRKHAIECENLNNTFDRAAERGLMKVVVFFVENGYTSHLETGNQKPGDTDARVTWWSPLHWALGQHEVMEYLLEHGADPDEGMTYWTPLLDCIGDEKGCRILKKYGAKENIFTRVARGDVATIRSIMMTDKEDVNTRDEFNRTPIFYARSLEVVKLLIELGADLDARDNRGKSIMGTVLDGHYDPEHKEADDRKFAAAIRTLLSGGADANACNRSKVTPLHYACRKANLFAIKELLREGAGINAKDSDGKTPLFRVADSTTKCNKVNLS